MTILTILIVFVVVGVVLWLINAYVPMEPAIKRLMNIAIIVLLVLWLIKALGFLDALNTRVP